MSTGIDGWAVTPRSPLATAAGASTSPAAVNAVHDLSARRMVAHRRTFGAHQGYHEIAHGGDIELRKFDFEPGLFAPGVHVQRTPGFRDQRAHLQFVEGDLDSLCAQRCRGFQRASGNWQPMRCVRDPQGNGIDAKVASQLGPSIGNHSNL